MFEEIVPESHQYPRAGLVLWFGDEVLLPYPRLLDPIREWIQSRHETKVNHSVSEGFYQTTDISTCSDETKRSAKSNIRDNVKG